MLCHCDVACTSVHGRCYGMAWVGWGGMITFVAVEHMLDATNKDLMLWVRCWQWRYEHSSDDLLKATGQKLNKL